MRILLVQPRMNWYQPYCEAPSTALLILGTLARMHGHEVQVWHMDLDHSVDFKDVFRDYRPELVGLTVNTFQVKHAKEISNYLHRDGKGTRLVVGGPHACVWDNGADAVVVGEGENKWLEILGERPWVNSIDDIPMLDYELVELNKFCGISGVGAVPSMCIMASRGCPSECIFCNTPVMWGRQVRYRNPQLVLDEIQILRDKYGAAEVFLQDDTFNLNLKWAGEILQGIVDRGLNDDMLFRICCRVNEKLITEEFLNLACEAGVWNIFYGIESGSQEMLDRMKKGTTVEEATRACEMTRAAGIGSECSFVIGLPGESWDTVRETKQWIGTVRPDRFGWCHAVPFPLTEFDRIVTEKGHKKEVPYEHYAYGMHYVRTDELHWEQLASFVGFGKFV